MITPAACGIEAEAGATERLLTPWFQDQNDRDRQRAAQFRALLEGWPLEPNPAHAVELALISAVRDDPEAARGWLDIFGCLALPNEVLGRPGMRDRLSAYMGRPMAPPPGPTRDELLALLGTTGRMPVAAGQ